MRTILGTPIEVSKEYTGALNCTFEMSENIPLHDILMSGAEREAVPLTIEVAPKINRPCTLKYPNKRRARRIWKKWAKRFGGTPTRIAYFPKVEIDVTPDENGILCYHVITKPIDNGEEHSKDTRI